MPMLPCINRHPLDCMQDGGDEFGLPAKRGKSTGGCMALVCFDICCLPVEYITAVMRASTPCRIWRAVSDGH
jgi:hypothetical protein